MKHCLFTILSGLSLVLCLLCAGMWVRSYWHNDRLFWSSRDHQYDNREVRDVSGVSSFGSLQFEWTVKNITPVGQHWLPDPRFSGGWGWETSGSQFYPPCETYLGFGWKGSQTHWAGAGYQGTESDRWVGIPHWLLVLLAAVLPTWWSMRRLGRQRRSRQGVCLTCGYDLLASPERCPECGTAVPSSATPTAPCPSDPI